MKKTIFIFLILICFSGCSQQYNKEYGRDSEQSHFKVQENIDGTGGEEIFETTEIREEVKEDSEVTYCQEITFMDIPWGTSYTEVNKSHPQMDLFAYAGDSFKTYSIDDIVLGDYQGIDFEYDDINIIGYSFAEKEVAGYTTNNISFYFAYGMVDGVLLQTEENSKLYGGQYVFETKNLENMAEDLKNKLSSIYGESDKFIEDNDFMGNHYTYTYWYGDNDTLVVLKTLNAEEDDEIYLDEITISYVWLNGDNLLQQASDYLELKARSEEEKVYGNENTDGL